MIGNRQGPSVLEQQLETKETGQRDFGVTSIFICTENCREESTKTCNTMFELARQFE
jgi:hypothetical protein